MYMPTFRTYLLYLDASRYPAVHSKHAEERSAADGMYM